MNQVRSNRQPVHNEARRANAGASRCGLLGLVSKRRNKPPVTVETNRQRLLRLRREQKLMAEGVAAFVDPDNAEAEWISKLPSRMSECGKDASFRPCWVGHLNKTWVKCCDCSICVFHQAKKSARHLLTVE